MQRKRIHAATSFFGLSTTGQLIATIDESNMVNVHGLRCDFSVEPENADANANGTWAISCLPRPSTAVPVISIAALELEADNPSIWACGVWAASNQTPYNKCIELKTSRNCQAGSRIVLSVRVEGVSSGNVRVIRTICYFTGM